MADPTTYDRSITKAYTNVAATITAISAFEGEFLFATDTDKVYTGLGGVNKLELVTSDFSGLVTITSLVVDAFRLTSATSSGYILASDADGDASWTDPGTVATEPHALLGVQHNDTSAAAVSRGSIIVGNSTPAWSELVKGTAGQLLTCNADDVLFTTATYPATTTINQLLYSSSANVVAGLATGNSGVLVTNGSGVPAIGTNIPTAVTIGSAYIYRAGGTDIPVTDGGTGLSAFTAYKLLVATNTNVIGELVAVGATGEYLAGVTGAIPAWATLNQAAVAGLTTASSPVFVTVKLSGLTDGYVPYHVADAIGLGDTVIFGTATTVGSSGFLSGSTGWQINTSGDAEFANIISRGILSGTIFKYDVVSAVGGQLLVTNADSLASNMSALDSSTMTIKGVTTFAVNDILLIQDLNPASGSGILAEYFRVTNIASAPTYTVIRDLALAYGADTNPAWKAGSAVVKLGVSDGAAAYSGGWLRLFGEGTNSPYYSVFKRTGVAYNAYTEYVRLGNLNGFLGYIADAYGIAIGETTKYLKYDPSGGLLIKGDITATSGYFQTVTLGKTGVVSGTLTLQFYAANGDTYINYGKTDFTNVDPGFILGIDDSDSDKAKFYIGDANRFFNWTGTTLVMAADNVGIGITNPTYGVHIKKDLGYDLVLDNNNDDFTIMQVWHDGAWRGDLFWYESLSRLELRSLGEIHLKAGYGVGELPSMVITTGDLVGIGTTVPAAMLSVQSTSTTDLLNLIETGGTEVFTVLESGNVGIGTTTPGTKLHVYATGEANIYNEGTTGANYRWVVGGTTRWQLYTDGTDLKFYDTVGAGNGDVVTIKDGGNVGIGTTTPVSNIGFGVSGTILDLKGTNPTYVLHSSTSAQEAAFSTSGAGAYIDVVGHATASNNFIAFRTRNTNSSYTTDEAMRITSAGNVGIGVTTIDAGYKFQIINGDGVDALAALWDVYSSIRWKENIVPIKDAVKKIMASNPVNFNWKKGYSNQKYSVGFIGEELRDIFPEVVHNDETTFSFEKLKCEYVIGVNYPVLTAYAFAGIKELYQMFDPRDKKISELENKVSMLEIEVIKLKQPKSTEVLFR